jgi:DNA topoisomerase-1
MDRMKSLVIVESPAKAKTIEKYLGNGYTVLASRGHLKDLPKRMGIDVEAGFKETFEIIEAKAKILSELKARVKTVDRLLLATDPDREGEAIAWHLDEELRRKGLEVVRVEFEEITKKGVAKGLEHPRKLDEKLYDAQRARRVLDRIVGYEVSALVWNKLAFGLSAGRVQSVALRLIVEREREIEAFVSEEYWNVAVPLKTDRGALFQAFFVTRDGEKIEIEDSEQAVSLRTDLDSAKYCVTQVMRREQKRNVPAPYTTSKLQQDASSRLRFTAKRTMSIAQKLYEGVDLKKDGGLVGLITYMRTDSVRVSEDAVEEVRRHIQAEYGAKFVPAKPNFFKSRKDAQEAHEAIRPTSLEFTPELVKKYLTDEQYKLYKLIWDRFVASQMSHAVYDQTRVDIEATPTLAEAGYKQIGLRANGKVLKFSGWLEQYGRGKPLGEDVPRELAGEEEMAETGDLSATSSKILEDDGEGTLPELSQGQALTLEKPPGVLTEQKFTQPPPHYNEGSLVRELEKRGIGRPSTYAEIISKVQARDYVEKLSGGQMTATELGKIVADGLVSTKLDFMDPSFTAQMEEELDEVAAGTLARVDLLQRFYGKFRETLEQAKRQKRWAPAPKLIGETCPECKKELYERWSKNGWFIGCDGYPKCKYKRSIGDNGQPAEIRLTEYRCEQCDKPMVVRKGRFGEFLSCSGYPECKTTRPIPLGLKCPKCGTGDIVERRSKKGRPFYGCSAYPACDFVSWTCPYKEPCPKCGALCTLKGRGVDRQIFCTKEGCGYVAPLAAADTGE